MHVPSARDDAGLSASTAARLPGLDGLRALAIVLVLLYHLCPGVTPGGVLGVDVFLVVSGYLITALLVSEYRRAGRVSLTDFWARRARRLLPALLVMLGVTASAATLLASLGLGDDLLVGIGWQLFGALTFSSNWWQIAQSASYLDQTAPELYRHLWSLAVEEQFYLLWPLAIIALLLVKPAVVRVALVLGLAVASALAMALVAGDPQLDPTSASAAYLSTLTHGFGLALGAALALARDGAHSRGGRPSTGLGGVAADVVGTLALAGIVTLGIVLTIDASATYQGGLALASALTAVAIVALAHPRSRLTRLMDAPLPRWLGERSYGLYVWHWPVLLLLVAAVPTIDRLGPQSWLIGLLALALSLGISAASWRWLEQPVRRRQLLPALRGVTGWSRVRRAATATASIFLSAALVAGSIVAVVRAPERSSAAEVILLGSQYLALPPSVPLKRQPEPEPTQPPPPAGADITAIGDSVMLASAPQLTDRLPGIDINAAVSRQMREAPSIIRSLLDRDQLRDIVVLQLGTNGPISLDTLHEVQQLIGPERRLVLVSVHAPRGWIEGVNDDLETFDRRYHYVMLADWQREIIPRLQLLAGDQVHPGSAGGRIYADVVAETIVALRAVPPPPPPPPMPDAPTVR